MCMACGITEHCYKEYKSRKITCPNINCPGAKANLENNYAKMRSERDKAKNVSEPKWDRMGETAKRHFSKTFLANGEMKAEFNAYIAKSQEGREDDDQKPAAKKNRDVTILPSIAVLNGRVGGPPPSQSNWMVTCLTAGSRQGDQTWIIS